MTDEPATSGWSSQPVALKVLLLVSVLAIVAGVVRCALELTAPLDEIGAGDAAETNERVGSEPR